MLRSASPSALLLTTLLVTASATAQGTFVNFETPQVKPITMAVVGGVEYLLACNTPDCFVEIYDPNTATPDLPPLFVDRVPVGQGPASVCYDPVSGCFYTANYIGDSISKVQLTQSGGSLSWSMVATVPVGEAPADVAVSADGATLFVTLSDASRLAQLDATTLLPNVPNSTMETSNGTHTFAVKEPRRVLVHNGAHWVANMKGGNAFAPHLNPPNGPPSQPYDLDLWTHDPAGPLTRAAGGLGTTNAGMAFGVDGKLYVVGSMARNDVLDEPNLRVLAVSGTGFVESWLWVVDPNGAAPTVTTARDLNRDPAGNPVAAVRACSQPMDVALLDNGSAVTKVYVATFGSDRLVVLTPNGGSAATWSRAVVGITITPQPGNYGRNGPRGLCLNGTQSRLYVLNRLSNSISVVDTTIDSEAVRFPLQSDYTPRIVRSGRRFLYSAEFSANGTVACSSCHVDARTDSLGWDLGTPGTGPVQHPFNLDDVVQDPNQPPSWHADKGILVTQSLQGLVNHPINVAGQDLFSNKPYHWRGDREDFKAFNGAFTNLMGLPDIGTPGNPMGISDVDMTTYRDFINTVMYTPNPEQSLNRVVRGSLGNLDDVTTGVGAKRGLKAFHIQDLFRCGGRSCSQCHRLGTGSNNRITEDGAVGGLETAQLRSLFGREGRVEAPVTANTIGISNVFTSHFGLTRDGHAHEPTSGSPQLGIVQPGPATIDRFVLDSFAQITNNQFDLGEDIAKFIREFDAGIAPSVGLTYNVTHGNRFGARTTAAFNVLEGQVAKANCGLAVYSQLGGVPLGWYFDLTAATPGYHQIGTTNVVTRATLLGMMSPGDLLVLQGTPAGSERRIASLNGFPGTLVGPAPQNVTLEPMRPPTHWADVPSLTANWDPLDPTHPFVWSPGPANPPTPRSIKTLRLMQRGLIQYGQGLGLTQLRHEASRRFAVAGDDIRLGARLQLRVPAPTTTTLPPPYTNLSADTLLVEVPLYPTDQFVGGRRVWESTVEADPLVLYTLLLGGPQAPGIADVVNTPELFVEPATAVFDPTAWNSFHVTVVNEDNTTSSGSWQTLLIQ